MRKGIKPSRALNALSKNLRNAFILCLSLENARRGAGYNPQPLKVTGSVLTLAVCANPVVGESKGPAVADFQAFTPWDFPVEGIAVDKRGNVYASIVSGQIVKFVPDGSSAEIIADLGAVELGGLAVDANCDLYIAVHFEGVYRIDHRWGIALVPATEAIVYPNALDFDQRGNLYVTESYSRDDEGDYGLPP